MGAAAQSGPGHRPQRGPPTCHPGGEREVRSFVNYVPYGFCPLLFITMIVLDYERGRRELPERRGAGGPKHRLHGSRDTSGSRGRGIHFLPRLAHQGSVPAGSDRAGHGEPGVLLLPLRPFWGNTRCCRHLPARAAWCARCGQHLTSRVVLATTLEGKECQYPCLQFSKPRHSLNNLRSQLWRVGLVPQAQLDQGDWLLTGTQRNRGGRSETTAVSGSLYQSDHVPTDCWILSPIT